VLFLKYERATMVQLGRLDLQVSGCDEANVLEHGLVALPVSATAWIFEVRDPRRNHWQWFRFWAWKPAAETKECAASAGS